MPDFSGWRVHDLDHRLRSSARLSTARPNYYLPNYYLPEVARVGGKPKIVSQHCFGKAADIEVADAGASAGTYIALATLNRICDRCSKLALRAGNC
jgi:hypothetical protein